MDAKIFQTKLSETPTEKEFFYWKKMLELYIETAKIPEEQKLNVLIVQAGHSAYTSLQDVTDYDEALQILERKYVKSSSQPYYRHKLLSRKQLADESIETFYHNLKDLSNKIKFRKDLTNEQFLDILIGDAFIAGLKSPNIRQRLLEDTDLDLNAQLQKALAIETAMGESNIFSSNSFSDSSISALKFESSKQTQNNLCKYCGYRRHKHLKECPATNSLCNFCKKKGHWEIVCISKQKLNSKQRSQNHVSSIKNSQNESEILDESHDEVFSFLLNIYSNNLTPIKLNEIQTNALFDTGADETFVDEEFLEQNLIPFDTTRRSIISLADKSTVQTRGSINCKIHFGENIHRLTAKVHKNLVAPVIIGRNLMNEYSEIILKLGGQLPPTTQNLTHALYQCSTMKSINCNTYRLLPNVNIFQLKPIASPSRRFTKHQDFVKEEIGRLLKDGIIRPSQSSWRAQSFVVEGKKKRLVIDYSDTINRYTPLDSYPIERIDDILFKIAQNKNFSKIDLKSAYHQVKLHPEDIPLTAFEAGGQLYEFLRLPFGCTNAVPIF